jgi:hypothetical protein
VHIVKRGSSRSAPVIEAIVLQYSRVPDAPQTGKPPDLSAAGRPVAETSLARPAPPPVPANDTYYSFWLQPNDKDTSLNCIQPGVRARNAARPDASDKTGAAATDHQRRSMADHGISGGCDSDVAVLSAVSGATATSST